MVVRSCSLNNRNYSAKRGGVIVKNNKKICLMNRVMAATNEIAE